MNETITYEWCRPYAAPTKDIIAIATSAGNLVLCKVQHLVVDGKSAIVRTPLLPEELNHEGVSFCELPFAVYD